MSLKIRQLIHHLKSEYDSAIDISDIKNRPVAEQDKIFLTRSLALFAIAADAGVEPRAIVNSIIDNANDNGIDAIYIDQANKRLILVQSKWHSNGRGTISQGEMRNFIAGCRDVLDLNMEHFNHKAKIMFRAIEKLLDDTSVMIKIIVIYSGAESIPDRQRQIAEEFVRQINGGLASDVPPMAVLEIVNLDGIISVLRRKGQINLSIMVRGWGKVDDPYAVYGQICAKDIADWHAEFGDMLVTPNIRGFLGIKRDTDVNNGILQTLLTNPRQFWHLHNGITILCVDMKPSPVGGGAQDVSIFNCFGVSIVNGAQTMGAIAAASKDPTARLDVAFVQAKIIRSGPDELGFTNQIVKSSNTQNAVTPKNFVAFDGNQERIREELKMSGINYHYKDSEGILQDEKSFTLEDAAIALACADPDVELSVQAKREVGRLWHDIKTTPYTRLFNMGTSAQRVWQLVQELRLIEKSLNEIKKSSDRWKRGLAIHGNRFVAHLLLSRQERKMDHDTNLHDEEVAALVNTLAEECQSLFGEAYPASLFKNKSRVDDLKRSYIKSLNLA